MPETTPSPEQLALLVGEPLYEIWEKLRGLIEERYTAEHFWNKGGKAWAHECKYRRGSKTLCALYAKENGIGFMVIFGKEEREKFEQKRNGFSEEAQKVYDGAKTYHDGKWIMFEPENASLFGDFIKLLAIKSKPDKNTV